MSSSDEEAARGRMIEASWWGRCDACGTGTAWFGDSEERVRGLVEEHAKAEHVRIWSTGQ
jgi:hypothetical protein